MQPLLYLKNIITEQAISIYDDGKIYGNDYGDMLGILSKESLFNINKLIKENMYMFKTLIKYNENLNPIIMNVRDDSRKHRKIEIYGWSQIPKLLNYIHQTESLSNITLGIRM